MPQYSASSDPVPAVREIDAAGETAEIFEDLRRTLGVPVVNLVWRHFATIPGALAFAWQTVRPAYVSGSVEREAEALRAALPLQPPVALTDPMLASVGIGQDAKRRILSVLDAYHRSNAMNFVALSALVEHLDGAGSPAEDGSRANAESGSRALVGRPGVEDAQSKLPHLLTLDEMTPATRSVVLACNDLGERDDGRILASMYRHLAHWPAFLALSWTLVAPLDAEGRLGRAIEDGIARGRHGAKRLLPEMTEPACALSAAARADLREAADTFVTHPIGKMVTICALLRSAMATSG